MSGESPQIRQWLAGPMSAEVKLSLERLARLPDVRHIAVMPDVHLADAVCVGVALATASRIYPRAVGGDIGCGMAAVALNRDADSLGEPRRAMRLLDALRQLIPCNRRHRGQMLPMPAECDLASLSGDALRKVASRDGTVQFGTLGRGNHFVEFQVDDQGQLWLMVHSGSRAMGQAIALAHSPGTTIVGLPADSTEGNAYLNDAAWAMRYAKLNRLAILNAACEAADGVLGASPDAPTLIDCCHNFVREETHFGERVWVHRKGAMSAGVDEPGIIPGSMGTCSYHVTGRGCAQSLASSSHGAGRAMSRGEARSRVSQRELGREMAGVWYDEHMAESLREEAPKAYRDIGEVMRAQSDLTRIVRRLVPLLVYKGA